ncbi:hypothetical protein EYF80_008024 [Liparis tanakae]|uniref:Uncharacterized protein n=1 Tax=Liparis tanakae TaxID=230148 RepID=A0A4Z2IU87_9TELE|nr:hypothetical protein EYF80_008024 [Liparis tanakae]
MNHLREMINQREDKKKLRLQQRRTREQLADQGIMPQQQQQQQELLQSHGDGNKETSVRGMLSFPSWRYGDRPLAVFRSR